MLPSDKPVEQSTITADEKEEFYELLAEIRMK